MTDAASQFAILAALSATGAVTGCALALINFADDCLGSRPVLRFFAEFAVVSGAGALAWTVVLFLADGDLRLFFALPIAVFCAFSYICISKILSPRLTKAKQALYRFVNSRKGGFLVKYILK